jgi:hypothetical protein
MPVPFGDAEEYRPFREACEAVRRSAAGKDAAEIRQMLTDEFGSRDIPVPTLIITLIAHSITTGNYDADDVPPFPEEPSWPGRAAGWVSPRLLDDDLSELTGMLFSSSPDLSWLLENAPDTGRYVPGPGNCPPPAQVILDSDFDDRMPDLFALPPDNLPPGLLPDWLQNVTRNTRHPLSHEEVSLAVRLEEDGGTVVVHHGPGHVGTVSAADAPAYLPHLNAARSQGKVVAATATLHLTGDGSPRVTVRLSRFWG